MECHLGKDCSKQREQQVQRPWGRNKLVIFKAKKASKAVPSERGVMDVVEPGLLGEVFFLSLVKCCISNLQGNSK